MGILDEAIREHLELKRQHGAADSELKELEDEAFGPADRPGSEQSDAAAEAPTEFMTTPETGEEQASEAAADTSRRREAEPSIADLQEPPPESAEEEQPAAEHEAVAPSDGDGSSKHDDRQAIAEQPTQHFDVEEEFAASAKPAPSDEELVEHEMEEPRLAPVDPLADPELDQPGEVQAAKATPSDPPEAAEQAPPPVEDDEDEDFWDDRRLSEELDQALEAPVTEPSDEPVPAAEPRAPEPTRAEPTHAEEPAEPEPHREEEAGDPAPQSRSDSDLLEDTPDFLEDAPEDDQLWFEQKPPKDFDFDD